MTNAKQSLFKLGNSVLYLCLAALLAAPAFAQSCEGGNDLDAQTRGSLQTTAHSVYDMAAKGDVFNLKQNSIPSLANNFAGVERAVVDNKASLSESQPNLVGVYFLDASNQTGTIARAEFFCGIFNSPDRSGFVLTNLPAGKYAIVIEQSQGKNPVWLAVILQDINSAWKIGGFYIKPMTANGHNGQWYESQAQQFADKGQKHNAYFYDLEARELLAPVPFMTTPSLDKLYDQTQAVTPSDIPANGPVTIVGADGKSYTLTSATPLAVQDGLDLVLKQEVPDASNTTAAFAANMGLIKAVVAKWPEVREIFTSVVARAQDAQGHDYGSLLPMKDIK